MNFIDAELMERIFFLKSSRVSFKTYPKCISLFLLLTSILFIISSSFINFIKLSSIAFENIGHPQFLFILSLDENKGVLSIIST